jgi:hypothetical protein
MAAEVDPLNSRRKVPSKKEEALVVMLCTDGSAPGIISVTPRWTPAPDKEFL